MPGAKLALILAAGNGSRLAARAGDLPKPLVRLHGKPLLEHVMRNVVEAGISRFVIVVGYRGQAIKEWYENNPLPGVQVTWIENQEYKKENGISVLRARHVIHENFLMLMADHIFDAANATRLLQCPLGPDEVALGIDRNISRVFDLDDATKVRVEGERIVEIGKNLRHYNALDTGMFLCSPALFRWLDEAAASGNCSLSDGLRRMTERGTFKGFDLGDAMWQDVDTPAALDYAERLLFPQGSFIASCPRPLYA